MSINVSVRRLWYLFKNTMKANGWTVAISEEKAYNEKLGDILFLAEKNLAKNKRVEISMSAKKPKKEAAFFVRRFAVSWSGVSSPTVGSTTLSFYGKKELYPGEKASRVNHWVLEKPVDLLALFEAHDRIARAIGCITILK